ARDYVLQNLWWIIPVVVTALMIGLGIWLVVVWLSSRGQFMFLHCVALDNAEVRVPWHKFAREANSLFRFRLVLGLSAAVVVLPLAVGIALLVEGMMGRGVASVIGILGALAFAGLA